jgi:hypothetical protein
MKLQKSVKSLRKTGVRILSDGGVFLKSKARWKSGTLFAVTAALGQLSSGVSVHPGRK